MFGRLDIDYTVVLLVAAFPGAMFCITVANDNHLSGILQVTF